MLSEFDLEAAIQALREILKNNLVTILNFYICINSIFGDSLIGVNRFIFFLKTTISEMS